MNKLFREGEIGRLEEYERRKRERQILIVTECDDAIRWLLIEANEAYFHGLFRATIALCRVVLEEVVRRVIEAKRCVPRSHNLSDLINSIPIKLWSDKACVRAYKVVDRGNEALHEGDAAFSEEDAYTQLCRTTQLIQVLVNQGGLRRASKLK